MKLIPLYGKDGIGNFAKVDDEDYDYLMQWRWYGRYFKESCNFYVTCNYNLGDGKTTNKKIHRIILKVNDRKLAVDHIDGDGLNNQKSNLRICSNADNVKNKKKYKSGSSEYKGVTIKKHKGIPRGYIARIQCENKSVYLGSFPFTEEGKILAAKAYNEAAVKHHKEFALLNDIENKTCLKSNKYTPNKVEVKEVPKYEGELPPNSTALYLSKGIFTIISNSDYEELSKYKWSYNHKGGDSNNAHAIRSFPRVNGKKVKTISIHRQIMNPPEGMVVDHINRNPLDNRRENLRICTPSQNSSNTRVRLNKVSSKYFGVFKQFCKSKFTKLNGEEKTYETRYWKATIKHQGVTYNIAKFEYTPEGEIKAAMAYNEFALKLKGEFAHINIIPHH